METATQAIAPNMGTLEDNAVIMLAVDENRDPTSEAPPVPASN